MTVEINNLSKVFGQQRAVDDISFSLSKGQILGFLGPNGAGKSTTMKMITSFLPPTSGSIKVLGKDTSTHSIETRRLIGYLPEHNPLYHDMYVREYLQFVCDIHRLENKKSRINDIIDQVGLGKEQHKLIGSLSKGYKQRVGLAQALIHNPEILILDEPTSGLDMNQLQDIRKLIKNLGKEKTVIFSTHIMQEVQALCDRVIIINNGRIVADDPIEILGTRMSGENSLTISLMNIANKNLNFEEISGVRKVQQEGNEFVISYSQEMDIREAVFHHCVKANTPILSMKNTEYNVEDVFQKLTKN